MKTQLDLFNEAQVEVEGVEPKTEVRSTPGSHRVANVPLRKRRTDALRKLMAILEELEGQTIHVSHCCGSHGHFWLDNLRLDRMRVQYPWFKLEGKKQIDNPHTDVLHGAPVIVLWGNRSAQVRIFSNQLWDVRIQEYFGFVQYLIDFWNGFGANPLDPYKKPGFDSLVIIKFKD